jgi:hypothetical protein
MNKKIILLASVYYEKNIEFFKGIFFDFNRFDIWSWVKGNLEPFWPRPEKQT